MRSGRAGLGSESLREGPRAKGRGTASNWVGGSPPYAAAQCRLTKQAGLFLLLDSGFQMEQQLSTLVAG